MPHIQDFSSSLQGATIFSKLDLVRGNHQIPMASAYVHKAAVTAPFSLFKFIKMPVGQLFIDSALRGLHFCFSYKHNLLIASKTPEEHLLHLQLECECLSKHSMVVNLCKCVFGVKELDFLGHHESSKGIITKFRPFVIFRNILQCTSYDKSLD